MIPIPRRTISLLVALLCLCFVAIAQKAMAQYQDHAPRVSLQTANLLEHAIEMQNIDAKLTSTRVSSDRPTYDHQNSTYTSRFHPLKLTKTHASLNPFFSPDHSLEQIMRVIQSAKKSIDISIPSMDSWIRCTYPQGEETCIGCTVTKLITGEKFPVFQALHNALHKGIKVRILSNDFGDTLCNGRLDLLTYLQAAGATVSYFNQLSFTHSKYIAVDGETVVVSSINFSRTSLMSNREAGIIIQQSPQIVSYTQEVFEWDFNHGNKKMLPHISKPDMDLIKNTLQIPVVIPEPYHFKYCNASSPNPVPIVGNADVGVIISPDFAFDSIAEFQKASTSFYLSIYQITEPELVDALIDMKKRNPKLDMRIFVSHEIYGADDQALALKCYNKLYEHGIIVRLSHSYCMFYSHQKFWIVDKSVAFMSTGNWSPTDYPTPPYVFPPYGDPKWRKTNRDFTVRVENSPQTLQRFLDLFSQDYDQGQHYVPK